MRQKGGLLGPPPVVLHPESLAAQAAYPYRHSAIAHVCSGPKCFPALGSSLGLLQSPIPAGIVNRKTPVAPLGQPQLNVPERKSHPRGKPLQPRFPKEPHHRRAADDSLTAKSRKHTEGIHRRGDGGRDLLRVRWWCARRIVRNFAYDCDIVRCLARGCDGSELVSTGLDVTCFRLVGVVQRLRDK